MFNYLSKTATAFKNPIKCFKVLKFELNVSSNTAIQQSTWASKYISSAKASF